VRTIFSVRLPKDLEDRLNKLASATNRPKSCYVREALQKYLEDLEDAYLTEAEYEEFIKSGEKAIPVKKLEDKLGLPGYSLSSKE